MMLTRDETGKLMPKATPIELDVPGVGPIDFRHVSMKSVEALNGDIERIADDRELIVHVLDGHSTAELSSEALRLLTDEQLYAVARDWAAKSGTLGAELDQALMPLAFRKALAEKLAHVNETTARAAMSLGALAREGTMLAESRHLSSIGALARERMMLTESWVARDRGMFLAAERLRRECQPMLDLQRQFGPSLAIQRQIDEQAKFERSLLSSPAFGISQAISRQLDEHAKLHREMLSSLSSLSSPSSAITKAITDTVRQHSLFNIPEAISLAAKMQNHASLQLGRNASATHMVEGLAATMRAAKKLELAVAAGSAGIPMMLQPQWGGELVDASAVTDTLATNSAIVVVEQIDDETEPFRLEELLADNFPGLVEPYRGSMEALERRGPDYIRHHAVSLRELLRAALHAMAPTDEVLPWALALGDPFVHGGKPTRRARVVFICNAGRAVQDPYARYVDRLVTQTRLIHDYLDGGVHRVGVSAAERHAQAMLAQRRTERMLEYLILIKLSQA